MWVLQSPTVGGKNVLEVLSDQASGAEGGGSAFAFATANGVKLLLGSVSFQSLLTNFPYKLVVGTDAITDTGALEALEKAHKAYPNLELLAFKHSRPGALFHPKTAWFRHENGGCLVTGSGNLTPGGLRGNWEAVSVLKLSSNEIDAYEAQWHQWLKDHDSLLLPIDHPDVVEQAKANKAQRAKVKKALKVPESDALTELEEAVLEEAVAESDSAPILIAEVPRSGSRWKQVNFDVATFRGFFGVLEGQDKDVEFRQVKSDGTLGQIEPGQAVSVKSHNYRFEIGAAQGLPYPSTGNPILVFEKITENTFHYVLLMPADPDHTTVQNFLDTNYPKAKASSKTKRRIEISKGMLKSFWPSAPFLP